MSDFAKLHAEAVKDNVAVRRLCIFTGNANPDCGA
jgi:hypothetical protein